MSLINKMLQDLDARGSQAGSALSSEVRPAGPMQRRLPVRQIAIGASALVVALAVAAGFWLKKPAQPAAPAVVVAPVAVPVAAPVAPKVAAVAVPAAPAVPLPAGAQVVTTPMIPLEQARKMPTPVHAPDAPAPAVEPVKVAEPAKVDQPKVRVARIVRMAEPRSLPAPASVRTVTIPNPVPGGREMNPAQRSETQYRNAMAALDEGRVAAALEGLEQALKLNPRHDAARQSLAALLIEAGRSDEAMQQLEQGLAIDPAQPSLAMLLARMQIERGTSGVATLLRTLPSAAGNADYHAFLAGALQRESRHREAAEQYGAALRHNPEHGVWLMGLGISLQAEKRDRDALAAFQRAKASGTLTPPLLAFVERKMQQLAP